VFAAGCGSEETGSADLPGSLGYVPADAYAVVLVPTDLEGAQLRRLEHLIGPWLRDSGGAGLLDLFVDEDIAAGDVRPLLGDTLVLGLSGTPDEPQLVAALETPDAERARALVEKVGEPDLRADGSTLVVGSPGVEAAIDRHESGDGMTAGAFEDAYGDGAGDDALVRVLLDAKVVADELDVRADVPWINALRWATASVRLESDAIEARVGVSTDSEGLEEDDLPLATGDDAPEAGDVDGAIAAANRDQSRTTVFLAALARTAYPDSEFVREVEALENDLGISFEDEVLRQFNGPSASVATPDGNFAAVSDVADPDRMRALLPKLAPRLPGILGGLQGLGSSGLVALLLFAPDAPLVPGALPLLQDGIGVRPVPGEADLYEITGLDDARRGPRFAVPSVVFGMIGDRFVVATDAQRAREVAEMDVSEVEDAQGAAVARADLGSWSAEQLGDLGVATVPLGRMTGSLEASLDGIRGHARIEVPDGLD
jgi:hypothetical protein